MVMLEIEGDGDFKGKGSPVPYVAKMAAGIKGDLPPVDLFKLAVDRGVTVTHFVSPQVS